MPVRQKMVGGKLGAETVIGKQARCHGARNVLVDQDDIAAGIDLLDQRAIVRMVGHQQDAVHLRVVDA